MGLVAVYKLLRERFGAQADPDTWWPIYYGCTEPPQFERAITGILVRNSHWRDVALAVEHLHAEGLLSARALAKAPRDLIAECVRPTSLQDVKAATLNDLGLFVSSRFDTEQAFCEEATRGDLFEVRGFADEMADRILLYACSRLAWPVDRACLRVLTHHGVVPEARNASDTMRLAAQIRRMVRNEMPQRLDCWQRLYALMRLEGARIGEGYGAAGRPGSL